MTAYAPDHDTAAPFDGRVREAWTAYKDRLDALEGRAYDDAETEAWETLQDALRDIEADREAEAAARRG
jgi:hypothetical protein